MSAAGMSGKRRATHRLLMFKFGLHLFDIKLLLSLNKASPRSCRGHPFLQFQSSSIYLYNYTTNISKIFLYHTYILVVAFIWPLAPKRSSLRLLLTVPFFFWFPPLFSWYSFAMDRICFAFEVVVAEVNKVYCLLLAVKLLWAYPFLQNSLPPSFWFCGRRA